MIKNMKLYLKFSLLLIVVLTLLTAFLAYRGQYLAQESSPTGEYTLKYYSSFNPFKIQWTMPGDSSCKPRWVRLYNKNGDKLNELYSNDCAIEMQVSWFDDQVVLPDGETIWPLPGIVNEVENK